MPKSKPLLQAIKQRTIAEIALLAQTKSKEYLEQAEELLFDEDQTGEIPYNKGASEALEQFAEDLWLRMNDDEVEKKK